MDSIYCGFNLQAPVSVNISLLTGRFHIYFQLAVFSNAKPNKDATTSKADETRTLQLDDAIVETGESDGTVEQEAIPEYLEWDEVSQRMKNLLTCNLKQTPNRYFSNKIF